MIYLNCEVASGLGEDTFWTWFKREFPKSCFDIPKKLNDNDIVLRYSTLGFLPVKGKQVALCWELYPQMKKIYDLNLWDEKLEKIYETAKYSTYRTVATEKSVEDYNKFGSVDVIPIGVNTELFKPLKDKMALRKKYDLPKDKKIGVWIGTIHHMKGYADLLKYSAENRDVFWINIWKWDREAAYMENARNFTQIPQEQIAELINAADFFLCTSRLNSYYMAEWEAMACDIPFVHIGIEKREFVTSEHPREDVFQRGWDRNSVKLKWEKFLYERGVEF